MSSSQDRPPSPSPSNLPPIPSSPTFSYASTALPIPSTFNLPAPPPPPNPHQILTKADLEASQTAYSDLLSTAKAYRIALASLSSAASQFGSALEACARLKEARSESLSNSSSGGMGSMSNSFTAKGNCTADSLMAASGVHQLIANHQQILSETVYRSFEVPLLHELDSWTRNIEESELSYQKSAKALSKEIRKMEKEGLKLHRQRGKRDVGAFREHLVQLTGKLDGLTSLSGGYGRGVMGECQRMSWGIVECGAGLVRAEVDIFEALARKGWSGGGLDDLLEKGRDLFANEDGTGHDHPNHGAKIFSILPQNRSILATGGEGEAGGAPNRADSLLDGSGMAYQSLAGAVSRDTDVNSLFSERGMRSDPTVGILNRPRGVRPFSPTPGERVRDPLEDYGQQIPSTGAATTEDKDGEEDRGAESASARTVVEIKPPEGSSLQDQRGGEAIDDSESVNGSANSERRERERERERRWSVTDDGVVSD